MPSFNYTTPDDLGRALRERYRTATGARCANIAAWFLTRSNTELQTWFGINLSQVASLRNRLNNRSTTKTNFKNQVGE